jgi:superfamily I DNA/RNA helicase/mRNA-degrading endonuclease RelE of RelBE toxin-antitoxin system
MSATIPGVKVAISSDFLKAFARIPQKQQSKVREFVEKFRANPTAAAINYEKLFNSKDPNVRSVRIDDSYRGIVLKPETGSVFVLVWVDHHDEAYRWAENRLFAIHPETGSLQILDVTSGTQNTITSADAPPAKGMYDRFKDRELRRIGVPDVLFPLVRSLKTEADLDRIVDYIPQEVFESLFMLAAGYTLEEVDREMEQRRTAQQVDQSDFSAALENPDSKRRFYVVEDAIELAQILNAPLEQWRVFLHPSQQSIVELNAKGPVKVLGGAGTGKTVVAMHRARWLAQNIFLGEHDRILFTTFTKNLAADIQNNLRTLCTPETLRKIEVINLDAWAVNFLKRQGISVTVAFDDETAESWRAALNHAPVDLGLPEEFFRDEWRQVVQANGISTLDAYLTIPRVGRGRSLTRVDRKRIWPVFEEYRVQLTRKGLKEMVDCLRDARSVLASKGDILPYKAVIVDEAQDMGMEAFKLIRQIIPSGRNSGNDIFIVGDAHQRIYGHKVVLSQCGVEVRGRSRKLRINYRTTEETRRWAVGILEGKIIDDLDDGTDTNQGYKSLLHGKPPEIRRFDSFAKEASSLKDLIASLSSEVSPSSICLVARTSDLLAQYEGALRATGVDVYRIKRSMPEERAAAGIRTATMHRVKGLEFEYMLVVGLNDGILPLRNIVENQDNESATENAELSERALLYVAATRARRGVFLTCHGQPSKFLSSPG